MLKWLDLYMKEYKVFNESGCFWIRGFFMLKDAIDNTKSTATAAVLKKYLDSMPHAVMALNGYVQMFARPDMNNFRTMDVAPPRRRHHQERQDGAFQDGDGERPVSRLHQGLQAGRRLQEYWEKYGKPKFPAEQGYFDFADLDK